MRAVGENVFRFEGHGLDLRRGCLSCDGRELELRPKSFEVLRYLVENAGRLLPKDEIINAVWPGLTVTDESLTRCISDVRAVLHDNEQRLIKTVPRRGYMFAAAVTSEAVMPAERREHAPPAPGRGFSLVVLPFRNMSGDPGQDYFADVLTDELTASLSRLPGSFVISRSTAFTYRGMAVDVKRVGRELGVRYALEGGVQKCSRRVRVNAQLIDTETGAHLWADQFDQDEADVLELQDRIVIRLGRALHIQLSTIEAARVSRKKTGSIEDDDLALQGEAIFLRYGPNRDETEAGYDLCVQALQIDPRNVRALTVLSSRYLSRVETLQATDRPADLDQAEDLLRRALDADDNFYLAHTMQARLLGRLGRPEEAIVAAEKAIALNPSYVPTIGALCFANFLLGRFDRMMGLVDRAIQHCPGDPMVATWLLYKGMCYFGQAQCRRAADALRQSVALNAHNPIAHLLLASSLAQSGHETEANVALQRYLAWPRTVPKTIAQLKAQPISAHPTYVDYRERLYVGLRRAGMPEE